MATTTSHNPSGDERGAVLEVPVRPEAVTRARAAVRRVAADTGLDGDRIDDLVVAVSEACTNALEANLRARCDDPIIVTVTAGATEIEVCVTDCGAGFEPDTLPVRPPLAHPGHLDVERGWGIQLMRELVDELVFDITGRGTTACLRMRLDAAAR